jgi:hypothetical protein
MCVDALFPPQRIQSPIQTTHESYKEPARVTSDLPQQKHIADEKWMGDRRQDSETSFAFSRYQQLVEIKRSKNAIAAVPNPKSMDRSFTFEEYKQVGLTKSTDKERIEPKHNGALQSNGKNPIIVHDTEEFLSRFVCTRPIDLNSIIKTPDTGEDEKLERDNRSKEKQNDDLRGLMFGIDGAQSEPAPKQKIDWGRFVTLRQKINDRKTEENLSNTHQLDNEKSSMLLPDRPNMDPLEQLKFDLFGVRVDVDQCPSDIGKEVNKVKTNAASRNDQDHAPSLQKVAVASELNASIGVNSPTSRIEVNDCRMDDNIMPQEVFENFKDLMKDVPHDGWNLGRFSQLYKERFGTFIPCPPGESVSQVIMRAEEAGVLRCQNTSQRVFHPDHEFHIQKQFRELMNDVPANGVSQSRFNELYKAKFGTFIPRRPDEPLSDVIKLAVDVGICQLHWRGSDFWVSHSDRVEIAVNATSEPSQQSLSSSAKTCKGVSLHENFREIMKDIPSTGVEIGSFNQLYRERFGNFIPRQSPQTLLGVVKKAEQAGVLALTTRKGGNVWIVPLSDSNLNEESVVGKVQTCEEVSLYDNLRKLMKDFPPVGMGIEQFNKLLYHERFGNCIPRQSPATLMDVAKAAEQAGILVLKKRNGLIS